MNHHGPFSRSLYQEAELTRNQVREHVPGNRSYDQQGQLPAMQILPHVIVSDAFRER